MSRRGASCVVPRGSTIGWIPRAIPVGYGAGRVRTARKPHRAASDKVNRLYLADRPNELWVSDFTYVPTWSGTVYVAFVIDTFARDLAGFTGLDQPIGLSLDPRDLMVLADLHGNLLWPKPAC